MTITRESLNNFRNQYNSLHAAAINADAGSQVSIKMQIQNLLDSWKTALDASIANNQSDVTSVSHKAATLAEQKQILKDLKAKQITRDEQSHSVNPKITQSPYVNILGLRRNFRYNTRVGLIVASVSFGILALGALGYYISTAGEGLMNQSALIQGQNGGRRR